VVLIFFHTFRERGLRGTAVYSHSNSMKAVDVELRNLVKKFGDVLAVDDLSLRVESGSLLTFLGPSGCGKTTTLRMIGGFEQPTSGDIFLMGKRMTNEPPVRRATNMVFQDYALFPHKTIGENIAFGLKMRGVKQAERIRRVREMLELINLPDVIDRKPDQLSGGQRQRVALARALILKPPVLLLDEPLGALDAKIRKQMQIELKGLQRELGITFIYVTHDQEEAMTLSDRIAVLNSGKLEQLGSPQEIYEKPKTRFVAKFIGECNLIEGQVIGQEGDTIEIEDHQSHVFRSRKGIPQPINLVGKKVCLAMRPEDIEIGDSAKHHINRLQGKLREKIYTGSIFRLIFEVDGEVLTVDAKKDIACSPCDAVLMGWSPDKGSVIIEE
jgi:spermidine/putrescine transport system ATP-binding protein